MEARREQLHILINTIDAEELDTVYKVLSKFVSEEEPSLDEKEAIRRGRAEFNRGEFVRHEEIDWE